MNNYYDKIDEVLIRFNLKCCRSECFGQKIHAAGIEGSGFVFDLYFSWKGEIIITGFTGIISVSDFCLILKELDAELKKLEL